jgi:glycerol-3-phosphate dehydrogenase
LPQFSGGPRAAIYAEATDGRPIFFIPWNDQLLVGTTEVPDNGDPSNTQPAASEIAYLINSANRIFPGLGAAADDVRYAFSGVRPLPFVTATSPSAITRRHILFDHADTGAAGMISVIGGKLTTAASLARECAHKIGVKIVEDEAPVFVAAPPEDGITSTLEQWSRQVAIQSAISQQSVYGIAQWHGRRALHVVRFAERDARMRQPLCDHSHHLVAEAVAAVEHEFAATLGDILLRRVPVALNACWSEECSRAAAERVGTALGWNEARIAAEFEAFEEERRRFLIKPARMPSAISARANAERST